MSPKDWRARFGGARHKPELFTKFYNFPTRRPNYIATFYHSYVGIWVKHAAMNGLLEICMDFNYAELSPVKFEKFFIPEEKKTRYSEVVRLQWRNTLNNDIEYFDIHVPAGMYKLEYRYMEPEVVKEVNDRFLRIRFPMGPDGIEVDYPDMSLYSFREV
ncbi:hypothetical protein BJ508DRAFT_366863 [Ascobolus immersus RN42]|uniref:Uncharacterized protein n=1 Tax=Ascobolus immersus RN42 TaxID=1160509 RepID=A0A3N4HGD6_ASCIM|nr:hypothetical protein BJ508DRAFT_366863 [Ascobolus immersus RN42]